MIDHSVIGDGIVGSGTTRLGVLPFVPLFTLEKKLQNTQFITRLRSSPGSNKPI